LLGIIALLLVATTAQSAHVCTPLGCGQSGLVELSSVAVRSAPCLI
jgi:hypothetical protein